MTAEESLSVAVRCHLSRAGVMSEVKMFGGTKLTGNSVFIRELMPQDRKIEVEQLTSEEAIAVAGFSRRSSAKPRLHRRTVSPARCITVRHRARLP
jgi:hypothetical protein